MKEITIYQDKENKKQLTNEISFDNVRAGEDTTRDLYIFNNTNYTIFSEISLEGLDIDITKSIDKIKSKQSEKITFKITPKITIMKPIKAKLKIKINYMIE